MWPEWNTPGTNTTRRCSCSMSGEKWNNGTKTISPRRDSTRCRWMVSKVTPRTLVCQLTGEFSETKGKWKSRNLRMKLSIYTTWSRFWSREANYWETMLSQLSWRKRQSQQISRRMKHQVSSQTRGARQMTKIRMHIRNTPGAWIIGTLCFSMIVLINEKSY